MRIPSLLPRVRLHRPGFDVLTLLCVILIFAHVAVVTAGGVDYLYLNGFYDLFGLSRPGLSEWRLWQVLTHSFLHANWLHLMLNGLMIYMIGGVVLHILGGRAFAKIYGGGIVLGSALHVLLHPRLPTGLPDEVPFAPLVGASAGAMALLLALTSLSPDSRFWPLPVTGKNMGRGLLLGSVILFLLTPGLGLPVLSSVGIWLVEYGGLASLFHVSHLAHLGGGLVGMVYARRLLRAPVSLEDLQRARARKEGMAA